MVAPRFTDYLNRDATIDIELKQRLLRLVQSWRLRIEKWEEANR